MLRNEEERSTDGAAAGPRTDFRGPGGIHYPRSMPIFRAGAARTRVLLVVLAVVSLVALFTTRVSHKMPDFEVYWTAGSRALAAEPLYREDDGHYQFKYLPAFAVIAAPMALAPLPAAKAAWFAASALLMMALLGLSLKAMPRRCAARRRCSSSSRSWRWRSSTRTSWCSARSTCCSAFWWRWRSCGCAPGARPPPGSCSRSPSSSSPTR